MLICKKCHTQCDEREKSCVNCGNPLVTEESPISCQENIEQAMTDPREVKRENPQFASSKDQNVEEPIKRLICPRCKIIFEHGNTCIKCGSPLVEYISFVKAEESPSPSMSEPKKEEARLSYVLNTKKGKLKTPSKSEIKNESSKKHVSQYRPLNRLPGDRGRKGSSSRKKQKKLLRLTRDVVSTAILIAAAGYLLWSLSLHFFVKRPEASTPTSKEVGGLVSPHSSNAANSTTLLSEQQGIKREMENIRVLLETIRQANLTKNIDLFMSCYSAAFKDREETFETWENFNYLHLSYDLKRSSISDNAVNAKVEWRIKFSPKAGGPAQESQTVLDVTFKKEDDGWKIKEVKTLN
jgi:RNA polymerase subunit RPABC4/transcription elongation factor Spt4